MRICRPALQILRLLAALCMFVSATRATAGPERACDPGLTLYLGANLARIPSSTLDDVPGAELQTDERQGSVGIGRFSFGAVCFDAGIDYQYTRYEYEGVNSRDRDLHRLQLPLRFAAASGDWQFGGYVAPGVSTSSNVFKDFFNRGSSDDVFVAGRFIAARQSGDRRFLAGLAYDRTFGKPRLYPVAGVEFPAGERLKLRLAYPDPGFRYDISNRQRLTGSIYPAGHQWHVVANDFASEFDYRVRALRSQLTWSVALSDLITIDLSGGYETRRRHELNDDLGARVVSDLADEWLLALGIRVGPAPPAYAHGATFRALQGAPP